MGACGLLKILIAYQYRVGIYERQIIGTPWINTLGTILFLHTAVKGKTVNIIPIKDFRDQAKFAILLFGYSNNH